MKKFISILLVLVLSISLCGCSFLKARTTESAKNFYDKVNESKILLDLVATDICAAWKDAKFDYLLSTKDVNDAIEKAKKAHSENISKINELDKEICDLFNKAKDEKNGIFAELAIKQVMTAYSEYKDSILNTNEALDSSGYNTVSLCEDSLDRALHNLFVEL